MVGSNKILTVSYGTFSCTLEGFEDSFGTMKAIAEYFRDLAADDRYFGAEPPVPDAEMLARIAEREVSRRVEARMDASGIVLRVGQAADIPTQTQPVAEPVAAAPVMTQPSAEPPMAAEPTPLRAEVSAPIMPPAPVAHPVVIAPVMAAPRPFAPVSDIAEPVAKAAPAYPDADSVAAKLQRIRAVVGKGSAGFVSPDDAEESNAALSRLVADPVATFADLEEVEPAIEAPVEQNVAEVDVAAILAAVEADSEPEVVDEAVAEIAAEGEAEAVDEAEYTEDLAEPASVAIDDAEYTEDLAEPAAEVAATPAPIRARVIKMRRADFDRAIALGMLVEDKANANSEPVSEEAFADDQMDVSEAPEVDENETEEFPDAAIDSFAEEEIAADAADLDDLARLDGLSSLSATSTLSDDDEADLLAELEAVERETESFGDEPAARVADDLISEIAFDDASADENAIDEAFVDDAIVEEASVELAFEDVNEPVEAEEDNAEEVSAANDTDLALMNILARVAEHDIADAGPDFTDHTATETVSEGTEVIHGLETVLADNAPTVDEEVQDDLDLTLAAIRDENLFTEDAAEDDETVDADAALNAFSDVSDDAIAEDEPAIAHAHLRAEPEADEAALSRIMSEADAQLSEPEASRRREAIAQLRAAVAATEAARRLGETPVETDTSAEEAFRDDLQQVVRPRRPMTPTAEVRSERPRPAPLKLVASQRIDLPQAAPRSTAATTMPIRPRRVTITAEDTAAPAPVTLATVPAAAQSQATSFADFAAEMGATSLSDLLEAAAAYTAFVEKSEDFSRPQLLKKVTQLGPDQFSREDGLRSFGTLLREGRITRTRAGRFQVSEETRFNPERRAG